MHASALMPPAQMCDEGGATMPQLLYFRPHSSFDMKGTAAYFSTSDTWDTPFRYWVSVKPLSICVCVRLSQMTRQNGVRESATFFVSTVDQESQHAPPAVYSGVLSSCEAGNGLSCTAGASRISLGNAMRPMSSLKKVPS